LREYDINYYLQEKPPVFWTAVGIGAVLGGVLALLLLRLLTSWFFALPLVLFEEVRPSMTLGESKARARGHRWTILGWLGGWVLAFCLLSAITTGVAGFLGQVLVPDSTASLRWLTITIGIALLVWAAVSLLINVLGTTTFAATLMALYRAI